MAHHQRNGHGRLTVAVPGMSSASGPHSSANMSTAGDDDIASDVDEPPDCQIQFAKLATPSSLRSSSEWGYSTSPQFSHYRKESLLTQGLLSSPELGPVPDAEAPALTSDGGLTSPSRTTTPSPPLPAKKYGILAKWFPKLSKESPFSKNEIPANPVPSVQTTGVDRSEEGKVEEGLGRRRCISFACGRRSTTSNKIDLPAQVQETTEQPQQQEDPPKRPCVLRFACPTKPQRDEPAAVQSVPKPLETTEKDQTAIKRLAVETTTSLTAREHRDSTSTVKISPPKVVSSGSVVSSQTKKSQVFNRVDFQKSEATRFNEFAGPFTAEDEWINDQTAYRQKITVNDTLRKENAIRRLAEEAEEEALDEDDAEVGDDGDELDDDEEEQQEEDYEEEADSDGGNETDDEEGFADSDDESDGNSEYQFWTPGLTTAATSTDQVHHIRPLTHRVDSESSVESAVDTKHRDLVKPREALRTQRSPRMRPGTPELPDSSDFVVGTLDEDRPLEEAYISCLEERRRSKHHLIPQDIDPSFPTSEPEEDNDEDDDANATPTDHESEWVMGRPDSSDEEDSAIRRKASSSTRSSKSPTRSPNRMHSPPPKRNIVHRSPPPRRLFGQAIHRLRSPPPIHRKLTSPPSSRRPSLTGSPHNKSHGICMPHLAQRPNLTHTTSLPRTPNPFWDQHRRSRFHKEIPSAGTSPKTVRPSRLEIHSRGPIDIVQGLEAKRQRRKDKFWRQHCRHAVKEKERRCQPGKGAQRMRELGLEMADRFRGYGQRQRLVLSV